MVIALTEARTELEYIKVDIGEVGEGLFLSWCNRLHNMVYRKLIKIAPHKFISETNYTISSDGYQDLPDGWKTIAPYPCGFYLYENGKITNKKLIPVEKGSTLFGYRIEGDRVYFSGIPGSTTITLVYIPKLVKFTDESAEYFTVDGTDSGQETITEEFIEPVAEHLALLYTRWSEDLGLYGFEDQIFSRALKEMCANYDDTPNVFSPPTYNKLR